MPTEQEEHTPETGTPDRVRALATPPDVGPTGDHAAVWLDDEGRVWAVYPTVPAGDDVLPMVWADEVPIPRHEVEERGCTLTRIAFCRTELLSTFGMPPANGAAQHATVWLDEDEGRVWADYPTASPEEDQVLPLVWAREEAEPRRDLEDIEGFMFTRIGWSR
ncbi:hypothetical protein [Streptomyces sp. 7N604]|uniref:hypothetical protein n=1 Tax=Streptomyces sp. 7N604 TaxID=3457415 RepID=UPI003FD36CB4